MPDSNKPSDQQYGELAAKILTVALAGGLALVILAVFVRIARWIAGV